jgi:SAM-dependent methyltransferase
MPDPAKPLPATPPEAIAVVVREKVILGEYTFLIDKPGGSDDLLKHPAVVAAFAADEYLPYWADLWPAARMLAKAVLAEPWPEVRSQKSEVRSQRSEDGAFLTSDLCPLTTALEVGCGLGLPGIAALARGLRVIFSDYDATAIRFAADNARLNGFDNFAELAFDWRDPPADLQVDVVLASDLTYEARHVEPLVALVERVLRPGGLCLWTDQDRPPAAALKAELARLSWPVEMKVARAGEPGGQRYKGTLYRIRRPG